MTKGLQLWPGDRMREFYRRTIARETALDADGALKLADALTKATNRMLVWDMPAESEALQAAVENGSATPINQRDKVKAAKAKPMAGKPDKGPAAVKAEPAKSEPAFDPYAFSAMVTLAKQGREGLAKRLADIKSVDHLKKFADAQHLGIDRSLTKIDELRKAILSATEQRLADRKAAAS
ncbi:MAG: hypothetical protein ABL907_15300 [Hyphomicrobium sp.]